MGPMSNPDRCGKSSPTGIRFPDLPARSQSLYRLRYPAHNAPYRHVKFKLSVRFSKRNGVDRREIGEKSETGDS